MTLRSVAIPTVILSSFILAGCSSSESKIIGKWNRCHSQLTDKYSTLGDIPVPETIEFYKGGIVIWDAVSANYNLVADHNLLTVTFPAPAPSVAFDIHFDGEEFMKIMQHNGNILGEVQYQKVESL